jgi:ABC-type histidine transport system ATPase subunit
LIRLQIVFRTFNLKQWLAESVSDNHVGAICHVFGIKSLEFNAAQLARTGVSTSLRRLFALFQAQ